MANLCIWWFGILVVFIWVWYGATTAIISSNTSSVVVAVVLGGDAASITQRVKMVSTIQPPPDMFILSGGTRRFGVIEAYALLYVIPQCTRGTCLLEVESTNTAENAACGMMRALDANVDACVHISLVVVTNAYHADRTERIFRNVAAKCDVLSTFMSIRVISASD
ncbi:MAG: ElyC/SanA/YdcF family protein, partial [Anaerolineales bacterium]|nr:ElyC/SanA/YdcF family protein [Anaerolineales bacterium]